MGAAIALTPVLLAYLRLKMEKLWLNTGKTAEDAEYVCLLAQIMQLVCK
jgi:hypothetical protein